MFVETDLTFFISKNEAWSGELWGIYIRIGRTRTDNPELVLYRSMTRNVALNFTLNGQKKKKKNTNHSLLVSRFNISPKSETNEQGCYRKLHSASSMATIFQSLKTDAEGNVTVDYFAYLAAFTDVV